MSRECQGIGRCGRGHRHAGPPGSRAAAVLLGLAVLASLAFGAGDVTPARAFAVLTGAGDPDAAFTVGMLRWPRTLVAIAVGAALGVAGSLLQAVARNPLAEPGLLGVSAGASFAVVVAVAAGAAAATVGPWVAVAGAAAGCALAVAAGPAAGRGRRPRPARARRGRGERPARRRH